MLAKVWLSRVFGSRCNYTMATKMSEYYRRAGQGNLYKLRRFCYANCWNMSDAEDALMWKAYAPIGSQSKPPLAN